jgi:GDPmannose 4,6-dehydratase
MTSIPTRSARSAIIVGAAGQDGQLLFESLQAQGMRLLGIERRATFSNTEWDEDPVDICNADAVQDIIVRYAPNEIYYLAAHHNASEGAVENDAQLLEKSLAVNVQGLAHFLEGMRQRARNARLFYAASSHIFGRARVSPQDETTPCEPVNVYGISKIAGTSLCRLYRTVHGVFAAVGILYNHESWLRRPEFVTRKIVTAVADIATGHEQVLKLANFDAKVDWGYAPDYVSAMQLIVRHATADDFVVASGKPHTVRDFCEVAFAAAGLDYRRYTSLDPNLVVRAQPPVVGNPAKLMSQTGWRPSVSFEEMVGLLVKRELATRSATTVSAP